jgi:hypothetical protein
MMLDIVEEAAEESFPASDPPAWTPLTRLGPPNTRAEETAPANAPAQTEHEQNVTRQTRADHDALLLAIHRLERALASAASGREQAWHGRVLSDLRAVSEALRRHVASAEGQAGLFAAIDLARPTLVRRVERLRRDHADLLQQATMLQRQLEHYGADERPPFGDIRQRTAWLLGALRHHQALEADLIFETWFTDIGAGD